MNKKVIYIFLLTTTLSRAYLMWRDQHLETCGSVCEHQREVWVCRKKTKQLHDCFKAKKCWVEYAVIIKQGQESEGFQVQIEAKVCFTSAGPHIKYTEAGF